MRRRRSCRSPAPTIEAACRFVTATGSRAAIGRLGQLAQLLAGTAGTQVAGAATQLDEPAGTQGLAS